MRFETMQPTLTYMNPEAMEQMAQHVLPDFERADPSMLAAEQGAHDAGVAYDANVLDALDTQFAPTPEITGDESLVDLRNLVGAILTRVNVTLGDEQLDAEIKAYNGFTAILARNEEARRTRELHNMQHRMAAEDADDNELVAA